MPRFLKILYEYFALYSSLTLLGLICLSWSVFALPLYFILPARLGTAVGRRGIMAGFPPYSWALLITGTPPAGPEGHRHLEGRPAGDLGAEPSRADRRAVDPDPAPESGVRDEVCVDEKC